MGVSLHVINMGDAGLKNPITTCPGFAKKGLADFKIDLMFLCWFACAYCSSNCGNNMRIRGRKVKTKLGIDGKIDFATTSIGFDKEDLLRNLCHQLDRLPRGFGLGNTIVMSMLTDPFSPPARKSGLTREVVEILLDRTAFRIRILTKYAIGLDRNWMSFLSEHRDRIVVGMSCGSLDDEFGAAVEYLTPKPSRRAKAFDALLDCGIPSYAMFCPVLPGAHERDELDQLIDAFRPNHPLVETVWAEPFNDRQAAVNVSQSLAKASHRWAAPFDRIFSSRNAKAAWSMYATDLLLSLRSRAIADGWLHKLKFLLYEASITAEDAARIGTLDGVLLQSLDDDGQTKNSAFRAMQQDCAGDER